MKPISTCLSAALLLAASSSVVQGRLTAGVTRKLVDPHPDAQMLDNRYIVTFASAATDYATFKTKVAGYGADIAYQYKMVFPGVALINVTHELLDVLEVDAMVKRIYQDVRLKFDSREDEEFQTTTTTVSAHGALSRLDQVELPVDDMYSYTQTGKNVTAFILDSGLLLSHSEFEGRATCGFDAVLGVESDVKCFPKPSHGTWVAGLVGGKTTGVAKEVDLVSVKVGTKLGINQFDLMAGFEYVISEKNANPKRPMVAVAALSFPYTIPLLDEAALAVINAGVPLVLSAGNNGKDACTYSPQNVDKAIVVGMSNTDDTVPEWSNYGECLDLYAPGGNLTTTGKKFDTQLVEIPFGGGGTSFSTPLVAGAIAMKLEENPKWNPMKVRAAILQDSLVGVLTNVPGPISKNRLLHIPV